MAHRLRERTAPSSACADAADLTRLNILFCAWDYFPVPAGGAERQARLQAEELVRRGHSVSVICPRTTAIGDGWIEGVRVRRLFRLDRWHMRRVTYLASIVRFLLLHGRRYDVIHVHLANLQADVVVAIAKLLRRPVYVKVACGGIGGEVIRLGKVAWATRWYGLRHADVVQALSEEIEGELASIGVRGAQVRRIPNGVDLSGFTPSTEQERHRLRRELDLPLDKTLVLFAGRFATYKGLADLLSVWETAQLDAVLVLVGSADTDRPMAPIVPNSRLIVRGWSDGIVDYLRAVDVFVYPSYADGMSNALMEAMACGLAVVASRSGATEEFAEDGRSARLFDAGDRPALADALAAVIGSPIVRRDLGAEARLAIDRFDIQEIVTTIEGEYLALAVTS